MNSLKGGIEEIPPMYHRVPAFPPMKGITAMRLAFGSFLLDLDSVPVAACAGMAACAQTDPKGCNPSALVDDGCYTVYFAHVSLALFDTRTRKTYPLPKGGGVQITRAVSGAAAPEMEKQNLPDKEKVSGMCPV